VTEVRRPEPEEYQPHLRWYNHAWRVALMLLLSALVWIPATDAQVEISEWWWAADLGLGAVAYVVVFFRRRHPLAIAVVLALVGAVSGTAGGPATLAAVSLATRRRWREIALAGSLGFAGAQFYSTLTDDGQDPYWLIFSANAIATAGMLGWGMYIGSRRELLWTLRARAERAEAEQELRAAQSRLAERGRIAREMHDVLAHRISQISMRAGALGYREDLSAEEMRTDAVVIRDTAHQALADLRAVLGVLRDEAGEPLDAPQPTYADLPGLVAEARDAGMRVTYVDEVSREAPVPETVGRTLYRIVQEGMTNARKHARDAEVRLEVRGAPDDGVDVVLTNPLGFGPTRTPGAGLGLVGLTERAGLAGGTLEHGVQGHDFVLRGWLPWPA
jgi:signal transduction histidine kinase